MMDTLAGQTPRRALLALVLLASCEAGSTQQLAADGAEAAQRRASDLDGDGVDRGDKKAHISGDSLPGVEVFPGHTAAVDCYCVPNLIAIPGRLVAITEARILNCDDSAAKTIATKASDDGGRSWQAEVPVVENSSYTNGGAAVWDNHSQALLVTYATNGPCAACNWATCKPPACDCDGGCRNIWLARSTDKGRSFSKGRNISDAIWDHPRTCSGGSKCLFGEFINPGPTKGVQLADGTLVFVVVDITSQVPGMPGGGIVSIRSTDFGASWRAGTPRWVPGWSETAIVHLGGDFLLANGRCSNLKTCGDGAVASRYFAVSKDAGVTWGTAATPPRIGVRGAICDGDMVALGNGTLLFSHPAGLSNMDDSALNGTFHGGDCFAYPHQVPGKKCAAIQDCPFCVDAPCRSNLTILSSSNQGRDWQPWASGFWPGYTTYPWAGGGSAHFLERAGYSSIVHIRPEDSASGQEEVAVLFESVGTMGPLRLIRFSMDGKVLTSLKTDDDVPPPSAPPSAVPPPSCNASMFLNVKDFGARGDGQTNDAPALQKAIDAGQLLGRTVFVPAGEYVVEQSLKIRGNFGKDKYGYPGDLQHNGSLRLLGEGMMTTRIRVRDNPTSSEWNQTCSGLGGTCAGAVIEIERVPVIPGQGWDSFQSEFMEISELCVNGSNTARYGIYASGVSRSVFSRVWVDGTVGAGFMINGWVNRILNSKVSGSSPGIFLGGEPNNVVVRDSEISTYGAGIEVLGGMNVLIDGNTIEGCGQAGVVASDTDTLTVSNNYFESNNVARALAKGYPTSQWAIQKRDLLRLHIDSCEGANCSVNTFITFVSDIILTGIETSTGTYSTKGPNYSTRVHGNHHGIGVIKNYAVNSSDENIAWAAVALIAAVGVEVSDNSCHLSPGTPPLLVSAINPDLVTVSDVRIVDNTGCWAEQQLGLMQPRLGADYTPSRRTPWHTFVDYSEVLSSARHNFISAGVHSLLSPLPNMDGAHIPHVSVDPRPFDGDTVVSWIGNGSAVNATLVIGEIQMDRAPSLIKHGAIFMVQARVLSAHTRLRLMAGFGPTWDLGEFSDPTPTPIEAQGSWEVICVPVLFPSSSNSSAVARFAIQVLSLVGGETAVEFRKVALAPIGAGWGALKTDDDTLSAAYIEKFWASSVSMYDLLVPEYHAREANRPLHTSVMKHDDDLGGPVRTRLLELLANTTASEFPGLKQLISSPAPNFKPIDTIYSVAAGVYPLLEAAARSKNVSYIDSLCSLFVSANTSLHLIYAATPHDFATFNYSTPVRVWRSPGPDGQEDILSSSQFLYGVSRAVSAVASLPTQERAPAMLRLVRFAREHAFSTYRRWVWPVSGQGLFEVKGWGCPAGPQLGNGNKLADQAYGHEQFLRLLLSRSFQGPPVYCNSMRDVDLWIIAGLLELLSVNANSAGLLPLQPQELSQLQQYAVLGTRLAESRLTPTNLTGGLEGLIFDADMFVGMSSYDYAACTQPEFPPQKCPAKTTSWDISHGRRFVPVFNPLDRLRHLTNSAFEYFPRLCRQFELAVWNGDAERPLFSTFLDGSNGWYRVGYSGRTGFGYGPWALSNVAVDGGWGLWADACPNLSSKLGGALWRMMNSTDPATVRFRTQNFVPGGAYWQGGSHLKGSATAYTQSDNFAMVAFLPPRILGKDKAPQSFYWKSDDQASSEESPPKQVTLTLLNQYDDTNPTSNPLAGLPALPKTHHSWPIYSFMATAQRTEPGVAQVAQWPTLNENSSILLDYARITHALPLDLNYHGGNTVTAAIVREVVFLCSKANASLTLNWSPFISFCQPECKDPRHWGPNEQKEIDFFSKQLSNLAMWLAAANDARPAHTSLVTVGAILIDQEAGWSTSCANSTVCCDPADPFVMAMIRNNDKVYSTAKAVFPEADVEQYGRGGVSRCSGLGDWEKHDDPAHANACWVSSSAAVWRGDASGPGNAAVKAVSCGGYTLLEQGDSYNPQFYNVGDDYGYGREAFNRTAVSAIAHGVRWVNPWVWLGGGEKLIVENWAGRMNTYNWNYETINSWMLGAEINNPYYGANPTRFALWGMAKHVMFYPSVFEPRSVIETPCGNCSVSLQHFVAYVHGANNLTRLTGTPECRTPPTRACDCLSKEYGLLSVDPGS